MFRLSIRSLLAKKLRLLTTAVAIVLGVAFTAGTMILADTMSESISTTLQDVGDGVDTVVRGQRLDPNDPFSARSELPIDALDTVSSIDSVAVAVPYWEGYTQVIGADGKALDVLQSVGFNWIDDPELALFRLTSGSAPADAGEVVLGSDTAAEAALGVGDDVDLVTTLGLETFTVVGLAELKGGASVGNSAYAFFHPGAVDGRLTERGSVDSVLVRGDDTRAEDELASAVAAALPGRDVLSGSAYVAEQERDIDAAIGVLETILLVFGVIALVVGTFTIANTFTITVAQRTRELALIRAIGASRHQVLGSVVIEATILGTVAAGIGLAGGLGVAKGLTALFGAIGLEFPAGDLVVGASTVLVSVAAGVLVTVGAALVPARRAASVAPVDAMRHASIERIDGSSRRAVAGSVLALGGAGLLALGVAGASGATVGLGGLAVFVGVILLGPVLVRPVTALLTRPMRRLGVSGRLAAANATRNPKRSAATAAALTIGVMLVAGTAMFASTAKSTLSGDIDAVIDADRLVRPIGSNPGIPTDVASSIDGLDQVSAVPMQVAMVLLDGAPTDIGGLDLVDAGDLVRLDVVEGSVDPAGLSIGDRTADDRGWSIGDSVEMTFADGTAVSIGVASIFEQSTALPSVIAPYAVVAPHGAGLDRLVFLDSPPEAIPAIEAMLGSVPTATVDTVDGYASSLAGSLDMVLTLVLGFLGLAVVIAVLGIATTVGLSVQERTRELGVLRAVGMGRRQLRRSIRLEAIVIALFGTVLGVAMGVGFTWAALTTLADDGFAAPVLPIGTLLAVAVGAVVAGTVAAALPARRAARRAVLDAIRAE